MDNQEKFKTLFGSNNDDFNIDNELDTIEYKKIHLTYQQRNKRKGITIIEGLDNSIDLKAFVKNIKKQFCCSGTIKDDEEKGETEAFAGKGKVLGGTVSKPAASVPWADLHRQRHQKHMERKKKEQAQKEKEEAEKRQKEQAHFAKIKETLQAEARERELATAEKKALLDAQRAELESKVEDKLIRDQLIKKKREERIAKKKQLAQEKKDAELAKQLQEEMEGGRAKSPVAVGSAAAFAALFKSF